MAERDGSRRVRLEAVTAGLAAVEAVLPDGRRLTGARAVAEVTWMLGGGWRAIALAARAPGAELGYRLLAAIRAKLPGDPESRQCSH